MSRLHQIYQPPPPGNFARLATGAYCGRGASSKPNLADWQALCKAVGLTEDNMPNSITQCKKTLKLYNANVFDLADAIYTETVVPTFPSVAALSYYSRREEKVPPKANVKTNPLLKTMLRRLYCGGGARG